MARGLRRRLLAFAALLGMILSVAGPASAQAVLLLDQDALFAQTAYGQAIVARFEADRQTLATENETLAAALEEEERTLTAKRNTMPAEDFARLAEAFDERVTQTRSEQARKAAELTARLDAERNRFFSTVADIVREIAEARGASVVLDRRFALLASDDADITPQAVRAVDERIGTGPDPLP